MEMTLINKIRVCCFMSAVLSFSFCFCAQSVAAEGEDAMEAFTEKYLQPMLYRLSLDDPFNALVEKQEAYAVECERNGDLMKALQSWQVVGSFKSGDAEVKKKISDLKKQMNKLADDHYEKGLAYFKNKSFNEARKEFLAVLLYNPDNREVLDYIQQKNAESGFKIYEIKRSATLKEVAEQAYDDPQKDILISFFNDIDAKADLAAGTVLRVPVLWPEPTIPEPTVSATSGSTKQTTVKKEVVRSEKEIDMKEMVTKAIELLRAKKYKEAMYIAQRIMEYKTDNREELSLKNDLYYQAGVAMVREERYSEALKILSLADSNYKDVANYISSVKKIVKGKAEASYNRGVDYYKKDNLDKAIEEWERTLAIDPTHSRAIKDLENTRELLKKLKKI